MAKYVSWVISSAVGTLPAQGYAYCGPDQTPSISDLSSPVMCNGKWKVGQASLQATDPFFTITSGGCPQITCNQLKYCSKNNDIWSSTNGNFNDDGGNGISCALYDYLEKDTYISSNTASETGQYFFFFNANVWRWAVSESITGTFDKDNCELYKYGKGFTAVSNVVPGDPDNLTLHTPWAEIGGEMTDGMTWSWVDSLSTTVRYIQCVGSITTPSPIATSAPLPTLAPQEVDLCANFNSNSGAQIPAEWGCGTPSPVIAQVFTNQPTSVPSEQTISPTSNTDSPTQQTPSPTIVTSSPSSNPTQQTSSPTAISQSPTRSPESPQQTTPSPTYTFETCINNW
eukprot:CAMPEP_0201596510 /NCGR_PEP_ID=MMETSP0190_2-20130828/193180_1 /ASSEMBLY_ACC=CAM_ASM_000263 /TAXON_ID=37353 /ORGANISM="Rosalina sp." /LENGTH=341 /DNA_ID=CAMNT_0048056909 /DNA_START=97 /DNA_END=1120 /DNA_ORIENTATION=-